MPDVIHKGRIDTVLHQPWNFKHVKHIPKIGATCCFQKITATLEQ